MLRTLTAFSVEATCDKLSAIVLYVQPYINTCCVGSSKNNVPSADRRQLSIDFFFIAEHFKSKRMLINYKLIFGNASVG